MTIYQVEQENVRQPYLTTDCRELLCDCLREATNPVTLYISRTYGIESKDCDRDDEDNYLILDSDHEDDEYTHGASSGWTTRSYVETSDCIKCSKELVDETIHLLALDDFVTSFSDNGKVYIRIEKGFDITRAMLLITMMLIYSGVPEVTSLKEFFKIGLGEISIMNGNIEPTNYASTRLPAVLILYYFFSKDRQFDWSFTGYDGITNISYKLSNYSGWRTEWLEFKAFSLEIARNELLSMSHSFRHWIVA